MKQPFYAAAAHLKDFYDIVLKDSDFESIGLHAWDKIGNKDTRIYKYCAHTINHEIDLPCNVDIIESVHSGFDDFQLTDNVRRDNYAANEVEVYIESRRSNQSPYYHIGRLVNYEHYNNTLRFAQEGSYTIIYKGVLLDEDGLPFLNYKEVEAIANYCAYVTTNKKAMMTRDKGTMELAQMIKTDWLRSCDDARTPIYLNENEMNAVLDVMNSWDRKRFGVSFKPLR
jgi:hypothetical protein